MKKLTTIVAAIAIFLGAQSFSTPGTTVTSSVQQAFSKQFSKASNVSWEQSEGYYYGKFMLDNNEVNVAYTTSGQLIGTSRLVKMKDIPMQLALQIREQFAGFGLSSEVSEVVYGGEVLYYFTAQNDTKFLRLKGTSEGSISVITKIKKQI